MVLSATLFFQFSDEQYARKMTSDKILNSIKIKGFRSFFQARQRYSFLHNSVTFTTHPKGISTQVFNTQ